MSTGIWEKPAQQDLEENERLLAEYSKWVDFWAGMLRPCSHTIEQTHDYFLSRYDVEQLDENSKEMFWLKVNVISSYFQDALKTQVPQEAPQTQEEMKEWKARWEQIFEEARNVSPEALDLDMRIYRIVQNSRSQELYQLQEREYQRELERRQTEDDGIPMAEPGLIEVNFEMRSGNMGCSGMGCGPVCMELVLYRGVSQEDIEKRSVLFTTFLSYLLDGGIITGPDPSVNSLYRL